MNKFTKFTALAVAALVMASTSAMAINLTSALENSRGSETINNTTIAGTPMIAGGTIGTTSTGGTSRFITGLNQVSNGANAVGTGFAGITNTEAALANFAGTTANAVGGGVGTANGNGLSGAPAMSRFYNVDTSAQEAGYARARLDGIQQGYAVMVASRGSGGGAGSPFGSVAGLASGRGIGGFGGANCGGGLSGALCSGSYGLGSLAQTGRMLGINTNGLARVAGGLNIAGGAINPQNYANLGRNLQGSFAGLTNGLNQSFAQFEAAGAALNRRNTIPTPTPSPNITQINNGIVEYE